MLELLQCVQDRDSLTTELQSTILRFEREVTAYKLVLTRFKNRSLLSQLYHHSKVDTASFKARETADLVEKRLTVECSLDSSTFANMPRAPSANTLSPADERMLRERRYMTQVDSQEVSVEIADPENQKEFLALLKHSHQAASGSDPVVSVLLEKLLSSLSAAVRSEVNSLPEWYLTEDHVRVDPEAPTSLLASGGDAKVYTGVLLASNTPVAVKMHNGEF